MFKKIFNYALSITILIFTLSCDQAPLFYNISVQVEPKDPIVGGTPTRMVVIEHGVDEQTLFVGSVNSSRIHFFRNGSWNSVRTPGRHSLVALGATSTHLGAIVMTGSRLDSTVLYIYDLSSFDGSDMGDPTTISIPSGYSAQSLFGAGTNFYIGVMHVNSNIEFYSVFSVAQGVTTLSDVRIGETITVGDRQRSDIGMLSGAAEIGGTTYLSAGGHVFTTASGTPSINGIPTNITVTGLINAGTTLIAVARDGNNGRLYTLTSGSSTFSHHLDGPVFTGGLGVKRNAADTQDESLLIGVRGSGMNDHGYRIIGLDGSGVPTGSLNNPSTTDAVHRGSIGVRPVLDIMQVPAAVLGQTAGSNWTGNIIFAGTSLNGLMSNRSGEWNAED